MSSFSSLVSWRLAGSLFNKKEVERGTFLCLGVLTCGMGVIEKVPPSKFVLRGVSPSLESSQGTLSRVEYYSVSVFWVLSLCQGHRDKITQPLGCLASLVSGVRDS